MNVESNSKSSSSSANDRMIIGYLTWIFGFMGCHRFYFGKPVSGTIYFFSLGLLGIGWLIDAFLIPGMSREAEGRFKQGYLNYNIAWVLLVFFGLFGLHRLYMGKIFTGIFWLLTGGLLGLGWLYDLWTLNDQLSQLNQLRSSEGTG